MFISCRPGFRGGIFFGARLNILVCAPTFWCTPQLFGFRLNILVHAPTFWFLPHSFGGQCTLLTHSTSFWYARHLDSHGFL